MSTETYKHYAATITVSEDDAEPKVLAGPFEEPGWTVMLVVSSVTAGDLQVTLQQTTNFTDANSASLPASTTPYYITLLANVELRARSVAGVNRVSVILTPPIRPASGSPTSRSEGCEL